MSDGLNKVMLIGNLGDDPDMRYTANGNAVTTLRLAVNTSYTRGADRKESTEWVTVVTWNNLAETVGRRVRKGERLYCEGRLSTRSWEDDGQKHYRTEVVAERVLFLSARREEADEGR